MLYNRNFKTLTEIECKELKRADDYLRNNADELGGFTIDVLNKYHALKPVAAYYYESLFPNNHLHIGVLKEKSSLKATEIEFSKLLETDITERNILNFINKDQNYNLVASIFHSGYLFGHHDAYLFKEFELTSTYKADYLLIGKNSHGYHFIFIELESPTGSITNKDGSFGITIRKGIKQVKAWNKWIEGNFHNLNLIFDKYKNCKTVLPDEFRRLNKTRINYVVIAGRRHDFSDETYDLKRELYQNENINLLHYDNLLDQFRYLQNCGNY